MKARDNLDMSGQGRLWEIDAAGVISTPMLPWGYSDLHILACGNGTLSGLATRAVLQTPLPQALRHPCAAGESLGA